jgi:UDP-N-acetylmuramate dehydrogenase
MEEKTVLQLKSLLPDIRENVFLKDHATFKIGGPATYFIEVRSKEDLIKAVTAAKTCGVPFFILGGGSNLLVSHEGFSGLIIKVLHEKGIVLKPGNIVEASAGVEMKELVSFCIDQALAGIEWSGGLPGTFGGAIRGNAGAFGGEIKDSILEVEALDDDLKVRQFSNKDCQFTYRSSIFKLNNWIVISAKLQLTPGDKKVIADIAQSRIDYRKEKQPLHLPNAGSVFKNCDLKWFSKEWQEKLAHVVKQDPFPVVPTAYLLSECNLKGTRIGGAEISTKHPNFIVNVENAKTQDVLDLIEVAKKAVKEKYGVTLEQEVHYLQ